MAANSYVAYIIGILALLMHIKYLARVACIWKLMGVYVAGMHMAKACFYMLHFFYF